MDDLELWCPSVDVCGWCGDSECDGISCIAGLDGGDHEAIEHLHELLRRGRLALQAEEFLAGQENRPWPHGGYRTNTDAKAGDS